MKKRFWLIVLLLIFAVLPTVCRAETDRPVPTVSSEDFRFAGDIGWDASWREIAEQTFNAVEKSLIRRYGDPDYVDDSEDAPYRMWQHKWEYAVEDTAIENLLDLFSLNALDDSKKCVHQISFWCLQDDEKREKRKEVPDFALSRPPEETPIPSPMATPVC